METSRAAPRWVVGVMIGMAIFCAGIGVMSFIPQRPPPRPNAEEYERTRVLMADLLNSGLIEHVYPIRFEVEVNPNQWGLLKYDDELVICNIISRWFAWERNDNVQMLYLVDSRTRRRVAVFNGREVRYE